MPLDHSAWIEVARAALDSIDADADVNTLVAACRVPVREVRRRLHAQMTDLGDGDRFRVAQALAEVRDAAGAGVLTGSLGSADVRAAAEALSFIAPEETATARQVFESAESDDVRLWLAMHLARAGDSDPIAAVIETAAAGRFDAELYYGDPRVAATEIRARAPLPEVVIHLARDRADGDNILIEHLAAAATIEAAPAEVPDPPTDEDVQTATAIMERLDLDGPATWTDGDPWASGLADLMPVVAAVPTDIVAKFVAHVVAEPALLEAGNLMVEMVATHPDYQPDVDLLHAAYLRLADSGPAPTQIAWVASRAPLARVIEATADGLSQTPAGTLDFLRAVARHASDPFGPILGGAPADVDAPPVVDLITMEVEEPALAASPGDLGLESLGPVDLGLESLGPTAAPPSDMAAPETPEADSDEVHALLDCPGVVEQEAEFELRVGLSPRPSEGVVGGPLKGLSGKAKPYIISVQVVADGFSIGDGEHWRHDLAVTREQPYPETVLHLTPAATPETIRPGTVSATYAVDGQIVGMAMRSVAVVAPETAASGVDEPPAEVIGANISIPTGPVRADLTVALHESPTEPHVLRMTLTSPHKSVPIPDEDVAVNVGAKPDEYARDLVRAMDSLEGEVELRRDLAGKAVNLAGTLPPAFWTALRAVDAATDGPPSLLLLTAEGRIPWELAKVDPPLDPAAPPFLATQTVMGRWPVPHTPLPPPHERSFGAMAVVTGDYEDLPRWETLKAAFEENDQLASAYAAEPVDATYTKVIDLLERDPVPSVVHMAVHGKYSPGPESEGLVLTDGNWLSPDGVLGTPIAGHPFVFLNACQVGSASEVLNQYSGLAVAFLKAGAAGVIAPLWSVKDDVARDIAISFYAATIGDGLSVGEAIRRVRLRFGVEDGDEPTSATFMAYQYFGHPELRLATSDSGGT